MVLFCDTRQDPMWQISSRKRIAIFWEATKTEVSMRCLLLLAFVGTALPLYGQAVKGTLLGTVTDSSKAVVPEATVEITETNTGISRRVTTNQNGYYVFADLESGVYKLAVEHRGFRRAVRERVEVLVNSTVRVDFELEPGTVSESVTVTAQAELLQTDRSDTGGKIETKQLTDMPLLFNRNFQSLVAARAWSEPGVQAALGILQFAR